MPSGEYINNNDEGVFRQMRDNARLARDALMYVRGRNRLPLPDTRDDALPMGFGRRAPGRDKNGKRVLKNIQDITFGPNGYRMLVGDNESDQEVA